MSKKDSESLANSPSKDKWTRIGTDRRSGLLVPLFSVYSKKSIGIGDLDDLKLLVGWCAKTGNSIIQLLPMNEVGPTFCPYDAISSFALEPSYLSLRSLEGVDRKVVEQNISGLRKKYPVGRSGRVNYAVKGAKETLLKEIYKDWRKRSSKNFKRFAEENSYWLDDFALFKVLKDHHNGKPWYEWEDEFKNRSSGALKIFRESREDDMMFERYLQWLLYKQFKDVKAYADSKDVFIMGDLPVLVSRDSADVWAHPEFFNLEYAAGAPSDVYCAKGQRWGVPTHNWHNISASKYSYLKERLRFSENFYHMLRIDHVVGLFRIWSIPYGEPLENKGLNGFFEPRDEKEWGPHGRRILSVLLESTEMLLLAEDLGIIPKICPKTLKVLGIPGNDVQRWMKGWELKHDFLPPKDYRLLSVAMLSTHDTTNWAAWWENEAGTVDEELFMRKCLERGIDYNSVKDRLFDTALSKHKRLRWSDNISSSELLVSILGKKREELKDFIGLYENSYREKEKLWRRLGLKGPMGEKASSDIVKEALKITLGSRSIFCIELLLDWLNAAGLLKGDPYQYRINTPGTISEMNWSLTIPIALEELLKHKFNNVIRDMVKASGRI